MLGQTISHYRITQKLGAGGMGVVYKAIDLKLERTVALKFLPQDMVVTGVDRERLLREARAASALDHPNIGVIHGLEESEDRQFFIVMGYYEGVTLAEKLDRGLMPAPEALDLAIQIARGLSAAHARNIVHRDIKPSNVIITPDNVVKIVDFGLARVVASASATQSMSLTGTLPYMAPEQILGEPVDQRSDVWALGVVLVQMITGSHPFVRPNTAAMTFAILNQAPSALDAVPDAVKPLIYRTLSKKPEHRQANASELLSDLEEARSKITATPPAPDYPTVTRNLSPREIKKFIDNASTPRWNSGGTRWVTRAALAVMTLLLVATAVMLLPPVREKLAGLAYASTEKHIVVLPFRSDSTDPEFELVVQGFSDSLTNELSNLQAAQSSLWVVPASAVRNRNITNPSAAFRELGATLSVEGRVRHKGKAVVVTTEVVDAKRMRQMGSIEVQNDAGDLAEAQIETVVRLARMLRVSMSPEHGTKLAGTSPDSFASYLKALGYMQRADKPGNLDLAVSALNSALQQDSRFALGYATLGEVYRLKFRDDHKPEWVTESMLNCQRAIEIDDKLTAAHVTSGRLNEILGKRDIALTEFQKALDIEPRNADALIGMATLFADAKETAKAEDYFKQAIALRPDYWEGYTHLADFYDREKRFPEAIDAYKRAIDLTPDNSVAYNDLAVVYMEMPDAASRANAETALRKSLELAPTHLAYANLGWLYLQERRYADSAAAIESALGIDDEDWRLWANLLVAYTWLNDENKIATTRTKAISVLERYALLDSKEAVVQSTLGSFYAEDNQREKALSHANAALALEPKNPSVLADLSETYNFLGDRARAVHYAQESLRQGYTIDDLEMRPALRAVLSDPNFRPHVSK
jgi:eukaryotic-like serine/threonine-protein kinase